MFERYTDRARRVVILAQEHARMLNHGCVGPQHLVLGMLAEGEGIAALTLRDDLGITLENAGALIRETLGEGGKPSPGHIPFTPATKKVLEYALREALKLSHSYVGTEHLLLGMVREGESSGPSLLLLSGKASDLEGVRGAVMARLGTYEQQGARPPEPTDPRLALIREIDGHLDAAQSLAAKLGAVLGLER